MHAPYRIAAPPEPDGPDPADTYEALLRTRAVYSRRVATVVCCVIGVLSMMALAEGRPLGKKTESSVRAAQAQLEARSADRIAQARVSINDANNLARSQQSRFATVVAAALDADLRPAARREPCNVALPSITRLHGKSAFPLLPLKSTTDRDLPSPSVAALLVDVRRADEHFLAGRFVEAILYANALEGAASRLHHDVIVAPTKFKRPVRNTPTSYEPGEITGRAYLYDFDSHLIVCAGDVHAESSRNVEYTYVATSTAPSAQDFSPLLDDDLDLQLQRAILDNALFKVD